MAVPAMKSVFSSTVDQIGYDENALELWVKFKSGKTYVYQGVPMDTAMLVMDAPSVGQALNQFIKGQYAYGISTQV